MSSNIKEDYFALSKREQKEIPTAVRDAILGYDEKSGEFSLFLIDKAVIRNEIKGKFLIAYWQKNQKFLETFKKLMMSEAISRSEAHHFPLYQRLLHSKQSHNLAEYVECMKVLLNYKVPINEALAQVENMIRALGLIRFLHEHCSQNLTAEQMKELILACVKHSYWFQEQNEQLACLQMIKTSLGADAINHDLIQKTILLKHPGILKRLLENMDLAVKRKRLVKKCLDVVDARYYVFEEIFKSSDYNRVLSRGIGTRQLCLENIINSSEPKGTLNVIALFMSYNWLGMNKIDLINLAGRVERQHADKLVKSLLGLGLVNKENSSKLLAYPYPSALCHCLQNNQIKILLSGSSAARYLSFFLQIVPPKYNAKDSEEDLYFISITRSLEILFDARFLAPDSNEETINLLLKLVEYENSGAALEFLQRHMVKEGANYDLHKIIELTGKLLHRSPDSLIYKVYGGIEDSFFKKYCNKYLLSYDEMITMLDNQKELMKILLYIYGKGLDSYYGYNDTYTPLLLKCSSETIKAISLILSQDKAFPGLDEIKQKSGDNGRTTRPEYAGFWRYIDTCETYEVHEYKKKQILAWLRLTLEDKDFNLAEYLKTFITRQPEGIPTGCNFT